MDIKLKCDAISPCFCQKTYFDNNDTYDLIDGDYCVYCLVDYNKLYDEFHFIVQLLRLFHRLVFYRLLIIIVC